MSIEKIERRPVDEERIAELRALFPEVMSDGRVNLDRLAELLEGELAEKEPGEEHYGLNWPGKQRARRLASQPPRATLRPVPGAGVDEEKTQNLLLVGDNLQILLALQKSYANSVKLIYIDPPYNTGDDFIYKDSFATDTELYLQETRQADIHGRLVSNPSSNGRFHSDWLSFIYPRISVAQRLLREDGFFVVSIDDAEQANLKLLLDSVLGAENFIATLVWDRNRKNDAKFFSVGHEYMLVYAKSKARLVEDGTVLRAPKEGVEEVRVLFEKLRKEHRDDWKRVAEGLKVFFSSIPEDDPRKPMARYTKVDGKGPYRDDGNISWPGSGGPRYEIIHPTTRMAVKIPSRGWVYGSPERFWQEVGAGRVVFGPDERTTPRIRGNLFESSVQVIGTVQYSYAQTAAQRFDALFGGQRVFDNPKPFDDLTTLVHYLTGPDDLVMDFFAGSGSTGHGVWLANQKFGTQRRFILVQLDVAVNVEAVSGKNALAVGLESIDQITAERLRRVSKQLRGEGANGDLGFRVLRESAPDLARPQTLPAERLASRERQQQLGYREIGYREKRRSTLRPSELFPELLLLLGFPLDAAGEQVPELHANTVWRFTHPRVGVPLLACLDEAVEEDLEDQLRGILRGQPAHSFVCRDESLNDQLKQRLHDITSLKVL